jgi:uncharacterized protein (TIGR02246 family)
MQTDPTTIATGWLDRIEDAWNRADGPGFGEAFAEESDFVDIRGDHHRGSATIAHGHQAIFDTVYAGSTVHYDLDVARAVGPESVLAVATSTLEAPTGPLQGTNHSRLTAVITRQGDRWLASAFQNTLIQTGH